MRSWSWYATNEGCFAVKPAPAGGLSVLNQVTFLAGSSQGFQTIQPIWAQSEAVVCSHNTSSGAAERFHGLDMWPMRDVLLLNQLVMDHYFWTKHLFWQDPVKRSETYNQSEPKLRQLFAAITPHLVLLNHSVALICNQWLMFHWRDHLCQLIEFTFGPRKRG
jgi:hypothetical protein